MSGYASEHSLFAFDLNGVLCRSTLPAETFSPNGLPYSNDSVGRQLGYEFIPCALDSIDAGEHSFGALTERYHHDTKSMQTAWHDQAINLRATEHGIVVDADSFGKRIQLEGRNGRTLLNLVGFEIDEQANCVAAPIPRTLQAAAKQQGLTVRLFPYTDEISAPDYLQTFADGAYPVATGSERYYFHDTGNDHMTAMLLGGQQLSTVLSEVAGHYTQQGPDQQWMATDMIDEYTSFLRTTVLDKELRPAFIVDGGQSKTARLIAIGNAVGILGSQTQEIIEIAQDTARMHNVPVPGLR